MMSEATATIRKRKNSTCAIEDAPAAMPPNPKIAATIAITKKTKAQYSMLTSELASPTGQRPFGRGSTGVVGSIGFRVGAGESICIVGVRVHGAVALP